MPRPPGSPQRVQASQRVVHDDEGRAVRQSIHAADQRPGSASLERVSGEQVPVTVLTRQCDEEIAATQRTGVYGNAMSLKIAERCSASRSGKRATGPEHAHVWPARPRITAASSKGSVTPATV